MKEIHPNAFWVFSRLSPSDVYHAKTPYSGDMISESTSLPWGYVSQSNSSGLPDPSGLALIIYMRNNGAVDIRKLTSKQLHV